MVTLCSQRTRRSRQVNSQRAGMRATAHYGGQVATAPQAGAPVSGPEPHLARKMAESFGIDPERYDRTRPRYPGALVDRIVAASPGPDFLDVGAGTGISARQFQAAGRAVLGVEPHARMADFARRTGVETEVARFETWDPAGRTFDAVVAGQVLALGRPGGRRGQGGAGAAARWPAGRLLERVRRTACTPSSAGPAGRRVAATGAAIDALGGSFTMRYAAMTVTAARANSR